MKTIFHILFFILIWFTNAVNAGSIFTNYEISYQNINIELPQVVNPTKIDIVEGKQQIIDYLEKRIGKTAGKVVNNVDEIKELLKTENGKAFFWSGRTSNGESVINIASDIAQSKGGTTLEGILQRYKIILPEWDENNPAVVKLWEEVSTSYANQVSGEVRAVIGKNLRIGNIWETVELPTLKKNPNVTKIYTIDSETKIEILLWKQ